MTGVPDEASKLLSVSRHPAGINSTLNSCPRPLPNGNNNFEMFPLGPPHSLLGKEAQLRTLSREVLPQRPQRKHTNLPQAVSRSLLCARPYSADTEQSTLCWQQATAASRRRRAQSTSLRSEHAGRPPFLAGGGRDERPRQRLGRADPLRGFSTPAAKLPPSAGAAS